MKNNFILYAGLFCLFMGCKNEHSAVSLKTADEHVEELEETIISRLEVSDFGGITPTLNLRKSGTGYLIMEMPPFFDGTGREIQDSTDFPEADHFEQLIEEYIHQKVLRDDREVFIIPNATDSTLLQIKYFVEHYWDLRKPKYRSNQ